MEKYKYREGSYAYLEPVGFESIRSMIDDEISNNKKTDEQQSEDISQEGQDRQAADEQFNERISALEEAIASGGGSSDVEESFNEFTGTTYPADKEALENKDAELEAAIAEKANSSDIEAVQAAIDTLNGDGNGSVKKTAEDAAAAEVAKVVAEAPEDLDTLKEVADYIAADKTKASEIESKLSEHDAAVEELGAKDEELEAAIAEKADASALEEEITRAKTAEQALDAKVDAKADNDALEAEISRAMGKEGELQDAIAEKASNNSLTEEKERAEAAEQALDAKVDTKADASTVADELTELKNKDTELEAKDAAQDEEIAKKVEWTESTPGRNHIVLKNHDSLLGTATDGTTYNLAMVSKWDVADFGTAQLHANLNSKDGIVTINDDKAIATKDEVETVDAKVDAIDLEPYAKTADVNTALENKANASDLTALNGTVEELSSKVNEKALQSDLEALQATVADKADTTAMTAAVAAVEATVATKADTTAVTAEIAAAIAPLAVKSEVTEEINAVSDALAQFETQVADEYQPKGDYLTEDALDGFAKESAVTEEIAAAVAAVEATVATKADASAVEALEATVADKADASAVTAEIAAAVAILNAKDDEQDAAIEEKANADDVYTKADADAKFLTDEALEGLATEDFVNEAVEKVVGTAPENFDTLEEFADALADLKVVDVPAQPGEHYTQEEIDAAQEGDDAYGKTTDDWKVEPVEEQSHNMTIGEFVETVNEKPQIEALTRKYEALLTLLNLSDADVNSVIVNEALVDSNNVVFDEGPVNNIVVPETTKSKTVTAELDPDTDLTLTSRYSVTINNTGEEPTNLNVNAPAVSGYNAATITLNGGEYDTVTLKDASLTVQSGATVQNVVITQDTTKNLTINAMFAEGATVTSESNAAITLTSKNPEGEEVSVVLDAPGASVTLNNGRWESIEASVSPNTLTINANVHIGSLTMNQGNVIVKVPRQSDIATIVENISLAEGCTVDYLHDEITSANVANLSSTGTHVLMEDIAKNGRIVPGTFASDDIVWDLNGHNMTFTNTQGYANFLLRGTVQLEINGNGTITNAAGDYGFWTNAIGAKLVVNGGTYYAATHVLYAQQGTIEVNGGEFHLTDEDTAEKDVNGNFKFLLNCLDESYTSGKANIIVKGGKFYGFNPAVSYGEPGGPVSFVADGFHVVESLDGDMKVFEVVADE